jgi:hypothetical protein
MAARKGEQFKSRMSNEHRVKIQNSNILNALIEHVVDGREMKATQVTAGIALLKKVMPDLSNVELSSDEDNPLTVVTKIEFIAPK